MEGGEGSGRVSDEEVTVAVHMREGSQVPWCLENEEGQGVEKAVRQWGRPEKGTSNAERYGRERIHP